MNEKTAWYVARSSGLMAWWLLAAVVLGGLVLATRVAKGKVTPAWLLDLHRHVAGLVLVFTGVHVAGLVADNWLHFGWSEVLLPMASKWRPGAVAAGIVATYLLLAIEVTSLMQKRLPRKWWRRTHSLSLPLFLLTTGHSLTAGTDAGGTAVRASAAVMLVAFAFLLAYRAVIAVSPVKAAASPPRPVREKAADPAAAREVERVAA